MSQRTLKHDDWVKIVESRRKGKKAKKKQSRSAWPFLMFGFALIAAAWLYFVNKGNDGQNALALTQQETVNIERYFSRQYMMGSWKFDSMSTKKGQVNVFIQIPTKLALSGKALERYIQQSLCPASSSSVWKDLKHNELYIHLYTEIPRRGDYAKCKTA